jgi:hypothetical protein
MFCNLLVVKDESSREVVGSVSDEVNLFYNGPNLSSCSMARGLTQPLTEISTSTRNPFGGKGRPAHKADNHTTICEPTLKKM